MRRSTKRVVVDSDEESDSDIEFVAETAPPPQLPAQGAAPHVLPRRLASTTAQPRRRTKLKVIKPGARVEIFGLRAKPELNNTFGRIISYNADRDRFGVQREELVRRALALRLALVRGGLLRRRDLLHAVELLRQRFEPLGGHAAVARNWNRRMKQAARPACSLGALKNISILLNRAYTYTYILYIICYTYN